MAEVYVYRLSKYHNEKNLKNCGKHAILKSNEAAYELIAKSFKPSAK